MAELLLLDKPRGISSAHAVARVKRALGAKKAGHAGTLDPLATGLLVIGLNEGTKALANYVGLPKTYEAEILLGMRTATGDLEGEVLEKVIVDRLEVVEIQKALSSMVGKLMLPAPAYSAMKQGGEPLYKKVRAGKPFIIPMREMEVRSAELLEVSEREVEHSNILKNVRMFGITVRVEVGSGTYIRSLAEELGRRLGYPATLAGLRRTRVGEFNIEDAKTLEQIERSKK